ncbi:MAG: prepilin-type N-terminal cleavage/methylation domain-containing protein [Gammaproteobacteria bacterium]|nr:prepilin-type N-terminal cleavage/methylation domain-containing protein [Gammaproteobacteria bacterium]MYI76841.1 prepilin-type N-terminal cleavage/methylation domain-containing protein [Gammaproteobacteria bacterium]
MIVTLIPMMRMRMMRKMSKLFKRGFTLVEMMVAIAILAISAMIIYSSNSSAIRHQLSLEETTVGHWLLLNLIEEEKMNRVVESEEEETGETSDRYTKQITIGDDVYRIIREPLETDSDMVELVEFSIELVDPHTGNHLIDRITTIMRRSE